MKCLKCGGETRVYNSRPVAGGVVVWDGTQLGTKIKRWRECQRCHTRFTTEERYA